MARAEAKEMVLSVRALFFVILYFGIAGSIAWAVVKIDAETDGKLAAISSQMSSLGQTERGAILEQVTEAGFPEAVANAVMNGQLPILVLVLLWSSTFIVPGLILLVGFNRISGDVSSRFTRYVLQRVHRESYLLGKIVGHWLVSFLAVVVVHCILLALGSVYEVFDFEQSLAAIPSIWAGMALFTFAYVAYTQLMSVLVAQPFLSLLFGFMGIAAIRVVTFILGLTYEPLGQIWLGAWDMRLWAMDPIAIAVFAAYGLGFSGLALLALRRRDV